MRINDEGLALIKSFESLKLKAYQDSVKVWTIGYGHTGSVSPGDTVTPNQATLLLLDDLHIAIRKVEFHKFTLNDNQFSALVSLVFNVGNVGPLMQTYIRAERYVDAANLFLAYNKAGGRVLRGLTRRRKAERELFLK